GWVGAARAQSQVTAVYPAASLRIGGTSAQIAADVTGDAAQVLLDADGTSATAGNFLSVKSLVVDRDAASAIAFHASLPLAVPFPDDGVLTVTVTPVNADGSRGTAGMARFDAGADPPYFPPERIQVRADLGPSL